MTLDEFLALLGMPPAPAHRRGDPDTSREAKAFGLTKDRIDVLADYLRNPEGMTDYEVAAHLRKQQNSAGKRRGEWKALGYIDPTEERRPNPRTNAKCIVWKINDEGIELIRTILDFMEVFGD